ncbi:hypothetical protein FRB99_006494 [Tulasnella sp. 403]|nr:hypothetical protein FRB99_006494 [Tulasnella sp. 403]
MSAQSQTTDRSSSLLLSTYDVVETLEGYLAIICPQACVRRPEDSESFTEMLDGCIVARQRPDSSAEPIYELYEPSQTQSELIIRAQKKLLIAREKTNVLVFGFRLLQPPSGQPRGTESTAFTDIMNEIQDMGTPFQSQAPNISAETSHPSLIIPHGASQAAEAVKSKPRFADYACSFSEVSRFIAGVTMAVIPHSFWGSKKNLKAVLSQVSTFISCRRFETITLHDVLQGLSTADCDWLVVEGAGAQSQRSSASDDLKKKEIFHEFLYWYFESFVSPLLKNTFYITDSSVYRNQVLYFRQDDWATLCTPLLERLSNATFVRLELTKSQAEAILRHRQLGYARVRLLPKDSGVRPIVNLRRKSKTGQSINQVLQTTFQILTFEKDNQPDLLGASVFGVNEIYSQLKAYRKRILRQDLTLPKLYFVKVDVRAAFDTIDQEKLISILHHILSTDDYNVRRWSRIMQSGGKTKRSFHRKAGPSWKDAQFLNFAESLAKVLHHAVFVDQVAYKSADKEQVLELLEEHIEANLVKIGPHFYRQKIGIPQGSVLSTLLCSFFYGDMEQKKFHFRNDPRNLLLRYVDDYLFVTTKLSMALHFLDVMTQGHPEYGCFISKDKTLTNFECEKHQPLVTPPGQRDFTWCGLRIDMTNLHVQADYERFQSTHLSNTLTVYRGKNPGVAFRQKMQHATKLRSHIIYLDTSLNGRKVVYTNIFQNLAFTAMKMHSYLKSWGSKLDHRQNFILRTILQCVDAGYAIARKRFGEKLAKRNKANFTIQRASFVWLGLKAFHVVLSRKSSSYPVVLEELKKRLERPGPAFQMKLRRIAKAAMDPTLTQIVVNIQGRVASSVATWFLSTYIVRSNHNATLIPSTTSSYISIIRSSVRTFSAMASQFFNLKATTNSGKEYDFAQLKGKVTLIVNTASQCGFTPQYDGLENLHQKYKDQGFVVLGFPSNQFGKQEPGSDQEIAEFCRVNHGVGFQLMRKSDVNGDDANEVFKYLKSQKSQLGFSRIKWNFEKFLVDRDGHVVARYASTTSPQSLEGEIEKLLSQPAAEASESHL